MPRSKIQDTDNDESIESLGRVSSQIDSSVAMGINRGIRRLAFLLNKFDTPCQSESEFVNHLVAAFKSGNDWIRIA